MRTQGATGTAVVALVILVAGCTGGGSPSPSATPSDTGPISYATGMADLVLQARSGGGLLPQSMRLAEMPDVSIYGDGRVVSLGSHGSGPQDPLSPELNEARVTADGIGGILKVAREVGLLGPDRHYDLPGAYDLWTVRFTVTADGTTHRVSAFGLGFEGEDRLAPPGEMEARKNLDAFYGRLLDLRSWLPDGTIGTGSAYKPAQTRVFVTRLVDWSTAVGGATPAPVQPRVDQEVRPWPLADVPELFGPAVGTTGEPWHCAVVGPDRVAALGLISATWDTRWRAGDQLYQIVVRPLLPDESSCPTSI